MLELKNIYKSYQSKKGSDCVALKNINLKLQDKGLIFVLGKSGSGKSTLLNIIGGLDSYDSGEIIIQGSSNKNFNAKDYDSYRNTYLGFIFQEFNVLDNFTVYENIALALRLQNKRADKSKVTKILRQVGLEGFEERKPNEISGGQRQRVAIARAIIKEPKIIFGDEPTGNLDSFTSKQVFKLLKKLSKKRLVIIVSHDRDSAEKYADRIIELSDGEIISDVSKSKKFKSDFEIKDDKVFLPKNRALLKSELKAINSCINSSKPMVFKHSKGQNFKKTVEPKTSDLSGFKLIKSKLPTKYATQIGISNFKSKPIRLVFTIFLTMVALSLFGLSQNFATYDLPDASARSFFSNSISQVVLKQGEYNEEYDSLNTSSDILILPKSIEDINKNFPNLVYDSGFGLSFQYGRTDQSGGILSMILSMFGRSLSSPYITYSNGLVVLPQDKFQLRLDKMLDCETTILGEMPDSDSQKIIITDYFANTLIENKIITLTDRNGDGKIDLNDFFVEGQNNIKIKDTFNFELEIGAIILTDYQQKYSDILSAYLTSPTDFSVHSDYTSFSNDVLNYYSVFFTTNQNLIGYIKQNYSAAKVSRFRFKNETDAKYFEEKSMETYETGYMFKKEGLESYLDSLLFDDTKKQNFINDVFSDANALNLLTTSKKAKGIIISLTEYNRIFKKNFESLTDFNEYFYDETGEISEESDKLINIGFFKMMSLKNTYFEMDLEVVGVYNIDNEILFSYPQISLTYNNISGFSGDELTKVFNEENFGRKALYVELPDNVSQSVLLLELINKNNMYHVSELSNTLYMVDKIFNVFSVIFRWVALILGIFSVILLFNFVSLSVINKQKDIGILRALGAKGTDVSKIFLIETLIMGLIMIVLSWGLIFLGTHLINSLLLDGFKGYFQSSAIEKISLLSVGIGPLMAVFIACFVVTMIATVFPTIKISRMKPVDAIKKSQ